MKRNIHQSFAHLTCFDMVECEWTHDNTGEKLKKNMLVQNKHPRFANEWYNASLSTTEQTIHSIVPRVEFEDECGDKYAFRLNSPFLPKKSLYRDLSSNPVIVFDAHGGGIVYY